MVGFIFDGAFLGFILARFQYLNVWGIFCGTGGQPGNGASPGECYWYTTFPRNKIGIVLHLGAIIPAGLLVVFQFIPIIRYKAILYHRLAGYVILLLVAVSDAGAIMVVNHAFGGDVVTQVFFSWLVIITTITLVLAMINIKRLQIDQHRAWMLRTWFYMASIITLRLIQIIAAAVQSSWPESQPYGAYSCSEALFAYNNNATQLYQDFPVCDPTNAQFAPDGMFVVKSNFGGSNVISIAASLGLNFGMAGVMAFFLHAVGIEIYLKLTPRESERLRQVSYDKQLEKGYKNPGSAGLVLERFGDADPWVPKKSNATMDIDAKGNSSGDFAIPPR